MSDVELDSQPLRGRRIFLVEEDDILYCQIKNSLQGAGGAVFGALAHFPDMPIDIPAIRFDVALLDVDGESPSLPDVVDELRYREIPILLMSAYDLGGIAQQLGGYRQLRKPYVHREAIASVLTLCSAWPHRPATQELDRRTGHAPSGTEAAGAAPVRFRTFIEETSSCRRPGK